MSNKNSDHYFLRGGGEMGELTRAKDWSKTALGDPADWPQSLCTMVAVMLDNPFGMYIAWGSEYIQIYNDGYRPILGATKHPQALGISTRETFSEIWHIIGPMFDGVMKGTAVGFPDFMLPLNRNGFVEECYFDFSYSPIRKENGEVGGVLVTVLETTEKKRATAALKESNERYISNIMQAPVAMCIFRGKNHVVEIANEQMLNLWGKQADQVMNKPIFEGLREAKDQGLESLVDKVYSTGEKFVANERPVNLPRNGKVETTYVNFVCDALKEADGTISGLVVIATEVTPQVKARTKVEESEQKFRALVENAPFPIAVYGGKEMIIELANQSIINIWGKGDDVIGKSFKEVLPELDNQSVFDQIEKVLTTGQAFHTKNTPIDLIAGGNLSTYYFNYSFTPLYDTSGNIYGVMNTAADLTELNIAKKRIEESDKRFRNTVKQAPVGIAILRGPQYMVEMANDAYLQLVDRKEYDFVGNPLFASLPEVEEAVHSLLDNVLNTGISYHGNEVPIPLKRYGKQGVFYFDFLYYPLKEDDGKISGVIVAVTEVTEKVVTRKKIEESKRLYETITQNTPDLIYVFDLNYRFTYVNEALLKMWGRTWDDSIGKSMLVIGYEPWHAEMHEREIDQVIATKMPVRGEVSFPHATLGKRMYDYILVPVIDQDGKVEAIAGTTRDITQQVEARKQIEESEMRFRNMVEQAPVAIAVLRGENYVVEVANEKQLKLWGKTKTQVLNKPIFTAIPEGAGQGFEQLLSDVFNTGKPFIANELPTQLIRNGKNEIFYSSFIYEPLYNGEHKIEGIISISTDVTEQVIARKKIEENKEALRESKERLEFTIECAKGGDWDLDLLTGKAICSFRHDQCFGATEPIADWNYEKFLSYVHPEDRENEERKFKEAVATGSDWSIDCRVVWKDGSIHWIQSSGRNYRYVDGKPTRMLGMVREVTEQKEAQKKIEESERRFRMAIAGSTQIVFSQDKNLKHTWIYNPHPDFKAEDIIGKTDEDLHAPATAATLTAIKQKILDTGRAFNGDLEIEVGGQRVNYTMHIEAIKDTGGNITGLIGTAIDITERIKTQQQIEESEQRFQAAVQAVEGILWTNNAKGEMAGLQSGWASLTGQTYEEYQGYGWAKAVHPDDAQPTLDAWNKAVQERRTFIFEHRVKTKEGQWRDFSIRAIPLLNAAGIIIQWVGVHTDITDNKQAANALKANEEKLTIVIEASGLGTWELDITTNKLNASDRYREIMGFKHKKDITLDDTVKLVHPDYVEAKNDAIKKSHHTGVFYFTGQIIWEDNSIHWIESKAKVFYDEQKNPIKLIGTTEDITEEKQQQKILSESEQKFRLLADSMPQHIWTSDPQGNLNYYNQSVFDYSGLTLEQINKNGWIQIVHPDDREENIKQWLHAVSTGKDFLFEHRFRRYDGEYRWQLSRAIPQKDENGKIKMWVGTSTDIQDQKTFTKELELKVAERTKELEASNTELQKMNKELQSFAYISSHDLQEPLRKIQTFATRISEKEENNLSDNGKDMFKRMQDSAKRMQTLIQDLLAYSRTNTTEHKFVNTDLKKIIAEVKEDLKEELKEKHATIEANQLCDADIIPFQFRQLLHNLIGNSLKFSNPNHPPIIQIKSEIANGIKLHNQKLSPQNKYCHITVSDNGIGFEQKYSEKIFEVFQRLHGINEYNGTGIGLSIVKKIVENHHGIITATGELNKGATFDIYIPSA